MSLGSDWPDEGPTVKRLIVNADDFGRTPGINRGIIEAHANGLVTSASVMVLEKAARDGIREAQAVAPKLSLGLHFVVTGGGLQASAAPSVPVLAPNGRFAKNYEALPASIPEAEIRRELLAQLVLFEVKAGRPPTHVDSHHHAALHPSAQAVFAAVAQGRGLPVRASSPKARDELRAAGLRVPDFFLKAFYGEGATLLKLESLLLNVPNGTTELMCHPGHVDPELLESSSYAKEREKELAILCDPSLREVVEKNGIELIGFDRLRRSSSRAAGPEPRAARRRSSPASCGSPGNGRWCSPRERPWYRSTGSSCGSTAAAARPCRGRPCSTWTSSVCRPRTRGASRRS